MSWQAINEVKAFGTPQGPERFKHVFKPTGRKGARGRGYSAKKSMLLALADKHLWPKVSKDAPVQITYADLAEVLACSVDTIKRNADWLDKAGLAIHEYAHDERGRRASNRFFINFDGVDRDEFAAAVLGKVVPKRRLSPTGQNALKEGRLRGNMHAPKGQYAGDQYLKTVRDGKREGGPLALNAIFQDGVPPSDWLQWCVANFVATGADIARSADRFNEHFASKVLTPEAWFAKWQRWCMAEKQTLPARAARHRRNLDEGHRNLCAAIWPAETQRSAAAQGHGAHSNKSKPKRTRKRFGPHLEDIRRGTSLKCVGSFGEATIDKRAMSDLVATNPGGLPSPNAASTWPRPMTIRHPHPPEYQGDVAA